MKLGIVGLPYSGKTTLFEAITGAHGAAIEHSTSAHVATIVVPDERVDALAARCSHKKVTYAHVDIVDVAGVASEQGREHNVGVLSALREVDGLVHVIRFFEWPSAPPHPHGSLDPARDAAELETELIVADLELVERRIERLEKQVTKPTAHMEEDRKELAIMKRLKAGLEEGRHVSAMGLSPDELFMLRSFQFLSDMPQVQVLNVHEEELDSDATRRAAELLGPNAVVIGAKIEKEISELDPDERQEFIEGMGLGEPASRRVIRASYEALGLRSFFTGTELGEELRAWTVQVGDSALIAAGTTGLSYDGDYFFGAAHSEGASGAQVNLLTSSQVASLDVGTAAAPTAAEMQLAILDVIAYMMGFKDDQGEPMNANAKSFLVFCPKGKIFASALTATTQAVINSSTNVLLNTGFNIKAVCDPRQTWTDVFVVFRTDARVKGLIRQEEVKTKMEAIAEGSEEEIKNNRHIYAVKAVRNVGYGYWQQAAHCTLV